MQCAVVHTKTDSNTYTTRKITESVLRNIKGTLVNNDWSFLEQCNIDDASTILNSEIMKAVDFYASLKTVVVSKKYRRKDPWFTPGLRNSSVECRKMYKKVLNLSHDNPDFVTYKNYKNTYKKLRRRAKVNYIDNLISIHRNDTKKLWTVLNEITGKKKNNSVVSDEINVDGVKQNDTQIISNGFARYYSEIGMKMAEKNREIWAHSKSIIKYEKPGPT